MQEYVGMFRNIYKHVRGDKATIYKDIYPNIYIYIYMYISIQQTGDPKTTYRGHIEHLYIFVYTNLYTKYIYEDSGDQYIKFNSEVFFMFFPLLVHQN